MTKRTVCLLLAILAAVELHAPAFALAAPAGPGGMASGISASAGTKTSLPAPTVKIAQTGDGIRVAWNAVQGSPRYVVYYRENGGAWHRIGSTVNTSYTHQAASLKTGSTYQFTVRCCDDDRTTLLSGYTPSDPLQYSVQLPVPAVKIAKTAGGIQVTWNAVEGSPRYVVYYRENGGSWRRIGSTVNTSYTHPTASLTNGSAYQFTVRCCDDDRTTLLSGYTPSGSLQYRVTLPAPAVKIAQTAGGIQVAWNAVPGSPRYIVYYRENGGSWRRIGSTAATSYTHPTAKLTNGSVYQFAVRCCGIDKNTILSSYTPSSSLKCSLSLAAPTVRIVAAANGITVTWNRVAGAAGYSVYYREGNGGWNRIGTTTGTSYTWKKAVSGRSYSFTVRCTDAAKVNVSTFRSSNQLSYVAAPTIRTVANTEGGVQVTWNAVAGAARYRVFYRIGSGGWQNAGDTAGTSCTVAGLKSGNTYAFTVRCLSANSNSYVSSYDSGGRSLLYLEAPAVKLANVNNGMKIAWSKVAGAGKYRVYFRAKGSGSWNVLGETTSTSCVWDDGVLGMSYAFTVRAIGGGTISAYKSSAYAQYTGQAATPTDT